MPTLRVIVGFIVLGASTLCSQTPKCSPNTTNMQGTEREHRLREMAADIFLPLPEALTFDDLRSCLAAVHAWAAAPEAKNLAVDDRTAAETYPSVVGRILRSTQIKPELIQQPNTVQVLTSPTTLEALPNPDSFLIRISSTTTYAELVPTTDDVLNQGKALDSLGYDLGRTGNRALCGSRVRNPTENPRDLLNCVLKTGPQNRIGRLASGITGTFTYGQNAKIQQNLNVNSNPLAPSKNLSLSGSVDFDAKKLFISGTDWYSALQSAALYHSRDTVASAIVRRCTSAPPTVALDPAKPETMRSLMNAYCVRRLAGPTSFLAALTPQVQFTARNQFDFIKNGGQLIAAPYRTNALVDLTFTVDLGRLIPTGKSRLDAVAALALASKPAHKPVSTNAARTAVETIYKDWASEPEQLEKDDWYKKFRLALLAAKESKESSEPSETKID